MIFLVNTFSWLPLSILYLFSDLLYLLVYKIIGYRKKVVRSNMRKAFPQASTREIKTNERKFYRNFCDFIVETIKGFRIKPSTLKERVIFTNLDELEHITKNSKSVLFLTAHHFNWEWMQLSAALQFPIPIDYIYHPLHNKTSDTMMLRLRGRFGAHGIKRREAARQIIKRSAGGRGFALLADQFPSRKDKHRWVDFMGLETAFYFSVEQIAKILNQPVLFFSVNKVHRGYYEVTMIPVSLNPREEKEGAITERYAAFIEDNIKRQPENWLWSHKRWKHSRAETERAR